MLGCPIAVGVSKVRSPVPGVKAPGSRSCVVKAGSEYQPPNVYPEIVGGLINKRDEDAKPRKEIVLSPCELQNAYSCMELTLAGISMNLKKSTFEKAWLPMV